MSYPGRSLRCFGGSKLGAERLALNTVEKSAEGIVGREAPAEGLNDERTRVDSEHHASDRSAGRGIPAHDRVVRCRARRDPDEVGAVGALLMGPDGGFITGSDFLMDGGVTAAYWYGELASK